MNQFCTDSSLLLLYFNFLIYLHGQLHHILLYACRSVSDLVITFWCCFKYVLDGVVASADSCRHNVRVVGSSIAYC
jgi:hypothetical protein